MAGRRPERPKTLHDDRLWEIIEKCWSQEPEERPDASRLLEFFQTSWVLPFLHIYVVDTYPAFPRFPKGRGAPKVQRPLPYSTSTWTLAALPGDHIDTDTTNHLGSPRQDTAESVPEPPDPSPGNSQIVRPRPVGDPQLGRPESPIPMSRSELPVSARSPGSSKANASPQNEDGSSPFGRAMEKLKKIKRSELISALLKGRASLTTGRKNYFVKNDLSR